MTLTATHKTGLQSALEQIQQAQDILQDAYQNAQTELSKLGYSAMGNDVLTVIHDILNPPAKPKPILPEPISTGLSPMWVAERCVIPIAEPVAVKKNPFIGKTVNVMGFAQGWIIADIFRREDIDGKDTEWAKLTHPQHGTVYRRTSVLFAKDVK